MILQNDSFSEEKTPEKCLQEITLLIITKDRPAYLKRALTYYDSFGIHLNLFVADSSSAQNKVLNHSLASSIKSLQLTFLNYFEQDVPPYQKCFEALKEVKTPYVVLAADDDFTTLSGVAAAVGYLKSHADYAAVEGKNIFFVSNPKNGKLRSWRPGDTFLSIEEDSASARLEQQAHNYQPTFYAVHRTPFLISLFEQALQSGCIEYPWGEFQPSFSTVIRGKVKRMEIFYGGRDHTDEFSRNVPPTNWVQKFKEESSFEEGYGKYRTVLAESLVQADGMGYSEAERIVDKEMDYFFKQQETKRLFRLVKKITPAIVYNTLLYRSFLYVKWCKVSFMERRRMKKLLEENHDWEKMKQAIKLG